MVLKCLPKSRFFDQVKYGEAAGPWNEFIWNSQFLPNIQLRSQGKFYSWQNYKNKAFSCTLFNSDKKRLGFYILIHPFIVSRSDAEPKAQAHP